jgi:hypothetical protein
MTGRPRLAAAMGRGALSAWASLWGGIRWAERRSQPKVGGRRRMIGGPEVPGERAADARARARERAREGLGRKAEQGALGCFSFFF